MASPHLSSSHGHSEPPAFVKKLVDQSVMVGEQLTLTATVKGPEPLDVSWVQDKDHVLRDGDNRKITFENGVVSLIVPKADSATAGKYTCRLSNQSGMALSVCHVGLLGWSSSFALLFPHFFSFTNSSAGLQNLLLSWTVQSP